METVPQLIAVLTVFAFLGFMMWWVKKRAAAPGGPPMRLWPPPRNRNQSKILQRVDSLQLSPTHVLSLVRMADRAILIGTSPSGFYLVESSAWKALQAQIGDQQPS